MWDDARPPNRFRYPPVKMQVHGESAVFTRPEFTTERVSYPVMTPTAAIGLLSSVLWKPQMRWIIERIEVLAPVRWANFRRNEVGQPITRQALARGYLEASPSQQRMTTMLRDVRYRIAAHVWVDPQADEQDPAKWRAQFQRRLSRGQTFRTPYLGMREFIADIESAVDETPPINWDEDLGIMLHSILYDDHTRKETYTWFDAQIRAGVMEIPRVGLPAQQEMSQ